MLWVYRMTSGHLQCAWVSERYAKLKPWLERRRTMAQKLWMSATSIELRIIECPLYIDFKMQKILTFAISYTCQCHLFANSYFFYWFAAPSSVLLVQMLYLSNSMLNVSVCVRKVKKRSTNIDSICRHCLQLILRLHCTIVA